MFRKNSKTQFICSENTCEDVEIPEGAFIECTDENRVASVCSIHCKRGYALVGESTVTCQENGFFTDVSATCEGGNRNINLHKQP